MRSKVIELVALVIAVPCMLGLLLACDGGSQTSMSYGGSSNVVRAGTERESSRSRGKAEFTVTCKGRDVMEFASAGAYITVWPDGEPGRKMMVRNGKGRGCGLPTFWLDGGRYLYTVDLDGYGREEGTFTVSPGKGTWIAVTLER